MKKKRIIRIFKKYQYLLKSIFDLTNNNILIDKIEEILYKDEFQKNE